MSTMSAGPSPMGGVKSFLYPWRSPWRLKKCSASRMAIDVNGQPATEHEAPTAAILA